MSAVIPLEHFYEWTPTQPLTKTPGKLPSMYDLPSEHPEDGVPDTFHIHQPKLLSETFVPPDYPLERRFVATDLYLYYDPEHTSWYKRPDWFAAVGVSHLYQGDLRYSYVMWKEKVKPLIVVELLSPETEKEDLGQTRRKPRRPPTKWEVYEQLVKVPYYAIFCRRTGHFQFFQLTPSGYQAVSLPEKRVFLPEIQLGLGVWNGTYDGIEYEWLRWYDATEKWIPTAVENTAQAQEATARAQEATVKAQEATAQAQEATAQAQEATAQAQEATAQAQEAATRERQRATQAEQRAEQLAAKLRALGIDPG